MKSMSSLPSEFYALIHRIGLVAIATLGIWVALLFAAPNPLYALCYLLAITGGLVIVVYPRAGVYLVVFLLIVQLPFGAFRYLGLLTTGSSLIYLLLNGKRLLPYNPILALCLAFGLATIASAIQPQTNTGLASHVLSLLSNISLVWLLLVMVDDRKKILNCVYLMIAAGVVTGLIALVQWKTHFVWIASTTADALRVNAVTYRGKTGFDLQQWRGEFRVDSIVGTPDYLPLYMQTIAPFVALIMVRQKRWSVRLGMLAILALFAVAHLLSYTRGALLTTALVVVCTGLVIDHRRFLALLPIAGIALVITFASWTPWRERLATMFDLKSNESTETVNTGAWRLRAIPVGIEIIAAHPVFGVGIGQGRWNWPESTYGSLIPDPKDVEPPPFHNDYLGIGVEMGLVGLAIFVTLLAKSALSLFQLAVAFREHGDDELALVSAALLIALIGLAASMMLYPLVVSFRYVWLIFGLSGALMQVERRSSSTAIIKENAL